MSEQPGPPVNPYQPYQPSPYGYGMSPSGVPYGPPPDHPQATTVLVLGVLSFALCQVLAPFAWVFGRRVLREIDAAPGRYGGRSNAQVGHVLGIVGTVILVVGAAFGLLYVAIFLAAGMAST
jgi:hypothetical protein